jgi:hypothetical protein
MTSLMLNKSILIKQLHREDLKNNKGEKNNSKASFEEAALQKDIDKP